MKMEIDMNTLGKKSKLFVITALIAVALPLHGCESVTNTLGKIPQKVPSPKKFPPIAALIKLVDGPTADDIEAQQRKEALRKLPITHPDRAVELTKIWDNVNKWTTAMPLSDDRISIRSDGSLFNGKGRSEHKVFIRAAAETLRSGHDGFVIVHLDYHDVKPQFLSLTPKVTFASKRWIGNFEDFRENRNEQNMFDSRSSVGNKILDGVIMVVKEDEFPNRDRFSAKEIYLNYLTYRNF